MLVRIARRSGALALLLSLFAFPATARQLYEIEDLGTFGGPYSAANGINSSGDVVGWAQEPGGTPWGFLLVGTSRINLTHFDGPFTAEALGLSNNLEESCGWGLNGLGQRRAVVWVFDLIIDLGTFGGNEAQAYDMNDFGRTAGWAQNAAGNHRPFRFLNLSLTDLGTLGGANGEGHGINNPGTIVGWSELLSDADAAAPPRHATRWSPGGTILDLGTLGGTHSVAEEINDAGQIVGGADTNLAPSQPEHAFLRLPSPAYGLPAGMNDLGTLPETTESHAWSINAGGEVVGYTYPTDAQSCRAFLWDAAGGMRDLNNHIITDDDWVLLIARGVNDGGQIVGAGLHAGVLRAYRLTPVP